MAFRPTFLVVPHAEAVLDGVPSTGRGPSISLVPQTLHLSAAVGLPSGGALLVSPGGTQGLLLCAITGHGWHVLPSLCHVVLRLAFVSLFPLLYCEFLGIRDYVVFIFVSLVPMLGWFRC